MITYRSQSTAPSNPLDALLDARRSLQHALIDAGMRDRTTHDAPMWRLGFDWLTDAEYAAYCKGRFDTKIRY